MFLDKLFKKTRKRSYDISIELDNQLDDILKKIKKLYPVKKYLLKEDIEQILVPQAELIHNTLKSGNKYAVALYSYITFHQIHFHLKNYVMEQKKKKVYKDEFIDIFEDIFIDNFLIFQEITKYISDEYIDYMNIWLDGFFINIFNSVVSGKRKNYYHIQPTLFFMSILFLSLPEISTNFDSIPFTTIINFQTSTDLDWKMAIDTIKNFNIHKYSSKEWVKVINSFFFTFFKFSVSLDNKGEIYFDDTNKVKCIDFINILVSNTDEIIDNILKIRKGLQNKSI